MFVIIRPRLEDIVHIEFDYEKQWLNDEINFFEKIFSFTKSCYFCNALGKTNGFLKC